MSQMMSFLLDTVFHLTDFLFGQNDIIDIRYSTITTLFYFLLPVLVVGLGTIINYLKHRGAVYASKIKHIS